MKSRLSTPISASVMLASMAAPAPHTSRSMVWTVASMSGTDGAVLAWDVVEGAFLWRWAFAGGASRRLASAAGSICFALRVRRALKGSLGIFLNAIPSTHATTF